VKERIDFSILWRHRAQVGGTSDVLPACEGASVPVGYNRRRSLALRVTKFRKLTRPGIALGGVSDGAGTEIEPGSYQ
jgi:hypothetical protein